MIKDDAYYLDYANRCKLIGYIIEKMGRVSEKKGVYQQFLSQRVEIFSFLETDELTLSDLTLYSYPPVFNELMELFGLLPQLGFRGGLGVGDAGKK